jgi:hypothetical protein
MANMEGTPSPDKKKESNAAEKAALVIGVIGGVAGSIGADAIENHADKNFKAQVEQGYIEHLKMSEPTNMLIKDLQGIIKEKGGIDFDKSEFNARIAVYMDRFAEVNKLQPGAATWARAFGEAAVAAMQQDLRGAVVGKLMDEFRDYSNKAAELTKVGDLTTEQSAEYEKLSKANYKDLEAGFEGMSGGDLK